MDLTTALIFVIIGLMLLLIEVFLMPGTAISGIVGIICLVIGIVIGFKVSVMYGSIILVGTLIVSGALSVKLLKAETWDKIAIKNNITSKSGNTNSLLAVGDEGKSITRLNPGGNARIKDEYLEVTARNSYIDSGVKIKVVKIEGRRVFVEPVT